MHYYKRNIGDYHKKAGRLSMLQHGAYTLLIDSCYDREVFPTMEKAIDWCWASSKEEIEAVEFVLTKFFTAIDGVYIQSRIQEDLDKYHETAKTNKRIATEREAKRKDKATKREQVVDESPPNHKPLTINQEPLTNKKIKVPYQLIVDAYHEVLPELPSMKILTDKRKRLIKRLFDFNDAHKDIDWWKWYFDLVRSSDHLMNRIERTGQHANWKCDLEWLVDVNNFAKVHDRRYH